MSTDDALASSDTHRTLALSTETSYGGPRPSKPPRAHVQILRADITCAIWNTTDQSLARDQIAQCLWSSSIPSVTHGSLTRVLAAVGAPEAKRSARSDDLILRGSTSLGSLPFVHGEAVRQDTTGNETALPRSITDRHEPDTVSSPIGRDLWFSVAHRSAPLNTMVQS